MKEMIKRVREEKGGFTLAELLIVVAIVMVLAAIAIPVFSGSMDSANASTDEANIRSGYAQAQVFALTKEDESGTAITDGAVYYLTNEAGLDKASTSAYVTKGAAGKLTDKPAYLPDWIAGQYITYTFNVETDGSVTAVINPETKK